MCNLGNERKRGPILQLEERPVGSPNPDPTSHVLRVRRDPVPNYRLLPELRYRSRARNGHQSKQQCRIRPPLALNSQAATSFPKINKGRSAAYYSRKHPTYSIVKSSVYLSDIRYLIVIKRTLYFRFQLILFGNLSSTPPVVSKHGRSALDMSATSPAFSGRGPEARQNSIIEGGDLLPRLSREEKGVFGSPLRLERLFPLRNRIMLYLRHDINKPALIYPYMLPFMGLSLYAKLAKGLSEEMGVKELVYLSS
ncbi:hypothetical protein DEO72_LG5g1773 [Vigna unguiculata]|uniref:Uncharacterized protein n=1 Tax=Vigna unguiculata TaxID=3917 RepID=A0A4D6LYC7_VIGUN|nr:hypothetical protein DEO72_LG5g1773 [Vigna unguiculata]